MKADFFLENQTFFLTKPKDYESFVFRFIYHQVCIILASTQKDFPLADKKDRDAFSKHEFRSRGTEYGTIVASFTWNMFSTRGSNSFSQCRSLYPSITCFAREQSVAVISRHFTSPKYWWPKFPYTMENNFGKYFLGIKSRKFASGKYWTQIKVEHFAIPPIWFW